MPDGFPNDLFLHLKIVSIDFFEFPTIAYATSKGIMATPSLAIIPNIREGNRKRIELEIKSNNILTEALKSIVDVKLTNAENYFKEKYRNTGRDVIPTIWKGEALPDFPRTIIEPLGITFIFMIGIFPLILTSDISLISEAIFLYFLTR